MAVADGRPPLTFVFDTGPILALDRLGYGNSLARGMVGTVVVPSTVADELRRGAPRPTARLAERLKIVHTPETALNRLAREHDIPSSIHRGELGVIALTLALRHRDPALDARAVLDDLRARKVAARVGLTPSEGMTGSLGFLTMIHDGGHAAASLPDEIALLQRAGYRFSAALVKRVLDTPPNRQDEPAAQRWLRRASAPTRHPRGEPALPERDRSIP